MNDLVNHPKHYEGYPVTVECIDITRHLSFRLGNAFKYVWRAGKKNPENLVEDLNKALWYLEDIRLFPQETDACCSETAIAVFNLIPSSLFGFDQTRFRALTQIVYGNTIDAEYRVHEMLRNPEVTEESVTLPQENNGLN